MKPVVTFERLVLAEWQEIGKEPPFNWRGDDGLVHRVNVVVASTWSTACLVHSWTRYRATDLWIKNGFVYLEKNADYVLRTAHVVTCLVCMADPYEYSEVPP